VNSLSSLSAAAAAVAEGNYHAIQQQISISNISEKRERRKKKYHNQSDNTIPSVAVVFVVSRI